MKLTTTAAAFHALGHQLVAAKENCPFELREFVSFYGASPEILAECWGCIKDKHLLWACMFMKLYLPEDVASILLGASKPTVRKWVWLVIEQLALHSANIIDFSKRKRTSQMELCAASL